MADETDKRLLHSHAHMTFMLLSPGQRGEGWGVLSPKGGWVLLFGQFRSGATGSFVSASLRVPMFKVLMVFTVTSSDCKVKKARFYEFLFTLG